MMRLRKTAIGAVVAISALLLVEPAARAECKSLSYPLKPIAADTKAVETVTEPVSPEALGKTAAALKEKWETVGKTAVAKAAGEVAAESKNRKYKLGKWDCALFTREVYHRAISRVLLENGTDYAIQADIGKTTYEQLHAMNVILQGRKQQVLKQLDESNVGDLVFWITAKGTVSCPNPKKKYGHVAIISRLSAAGDVIGYDNTKNKGVRERKLSRIFKKAPANAQLLVVRPDFSSLNAVGNTLQTEGEHRIIIEINKNN